MDQRSGSAQRVEGPDAPRQVGIVTRDTEIESAL
jgi:hypothetical protein